MLFPVVVFGQSFSECAIQCKREFDRIDKELLNEKLDRKKINQTEFDSLKFAAMKSFDSCTIGKTLPECTLIGRSGQVYTNESFAGKIVMLNIWSIHYGPCVMEIPVLNRIAHAYGENSNFLLISILVEKEEEINKLFSKLIRPMTIDFEVPHS